MKTINKIYKAMWESWDGIIDSNFKMWVTIGNEKVPITINEMDLYLPETEVMDTNAMGKVFFHPACENITSKETEVFKIIRNITIMKLLGTFTTYPIILGPIGNRKPSKNWTNAVKNVALDLKGFKKTVIDEVANFVKLMTVETDNSNFDYRMVHIKTTKSGRRSRGTGDKSYYTSKPVFPVYNELTKKLARNNSKAENQLVPIYDTELSVGAIRYLTKIFEVTFPGINNPEEYTCEAYSPTAARLISYLNCYSLLADDLNTIQNIFRTDFDKAGIQRIHNDWVEQLEEIPDCCDEVPELDYNSHNTQTEAKNNFNNNSQLFNIESNQSNGNNNNGGNNNFNNQQGNIVNYNGVEFDISPPQMLNGDVYKSYELDFTGTYPRVKHYATSTSGLTVVYMCSKMGNYLSRQELGGSGLGMGYGAGFGMGINPNQQMLIQQLRASGYNDYQIAAYLQQQQQQHQGSFANSGVSAGVTSSGSGDFTY